MISIQQNITELEKVHRMQGMAVECYRYAIATMAQYTVEMNEIITPPHRKYLSDLAEEVARHGSAEQLEDSRTVLRGLLRDYRDRSADYMCSLRDQLNSTAEALSVMVESLSQSDTEHTAKLHGALVSLREVAKTSKNAVLRSAIGGAADTIEESLEQIRKQNQFTIAQFQIELRLLHNRIDELETAKVTDEATKFSNHRFLSEYLKSMPPEGASFLALKFHGLAEARTKFGDALVDDLLGTFGRRLRNTIPKDAVVARFSDQDFLAILPGKTVAAQKVSEHLSLPYACMVGGKVVRIPLAATAEYLAISGRPTSEEIEKRLSQALG